MFQGKILLYLHTCAAAIQRLHDLYFSICFAKVSSPGESSLSAMLLRSVARCSAARSAVRLGAPAGGKKQGESWDGPLPVSESFKYGFMPFNDRAHYGMMNWPRLDYGPHRFDYGTVKRPSGVLSNIFWGIVEIPKIAKADQWAFFRLLRHLTGVSFWLCIMHFIYKDRPVTNL